MDRPGKCRGRPCRPSHQRRVRRGAADRPRARAVGRPIAQRRSPVPRQHRRLLDRAFGRSDVAEDPRRHPARLVETLHDQPDEGRAVDPRRLVHTLPSVAAAVIHPDGRRCWKRSLLPEVRGLRRSESVTRRSTGEGRRRLRDQQCKADGEHNGDGGDEDEKCRSPTPWARLAPGASDRVSLVRIGPSRVRTGRRPDRVRQWMTQGSTSPSDGRHRLKRTRSFEHSGGECLGNPRSGRPGTPSSPGRPSGNHSGSTRRR